MKNAVMVSQTEFSKKNIGDYVQAIAARQFSPMKGHEPIVCYGMVKLLGQIIRA